MERSDLDDIAGRPVAYWHIDGVPELGAGVLWLVWGGAVLLGDLVPRDWRADAYWAVVPILLATSAFAATWAIKRVKARLTFPRTGYVAWREPTTAVRLAAAAVGAVAAGAISIAVIKGDPSTAAPALGGILGLAFAIAAVRWRLGHYLLLAAAAVALGFAVARVAAGWQAANLALLAMGAVTTITGAVRLAVFLRKHPRAATETA